MEMSLIQGVKLSSTEAGATTHPHRSYCALRELAALLSAFSKPPVSFFVLYAINLAVSRRPSSTCGAETPKANHIGRVGCPPRV